MPKITGDEPALPSGMYGQQTASGLTIRQLFTALALCGYNANANLFNTDSETTLAAKMKRSEQDAQALIDQFNKTQ